MRRSVRKIIGSSKKPSKSSLKSSSKSVKKKILKLGRETAGFLRQAWEEDVGGLPFSGPAENKDRRLPERYDENRLVLMVRDPWWLYAYWEVTPWKRDEINARLAREGAVADKTVLRVYDVTGASIENPNSFFDIELNFFADNWYVDVGKPDGEWIAELGLRTQDGRFFAWVRSNRVKTPAYGVSDLLDEEWMLPEDIYARLLGLSGIYRSGADSMDFRKLLEKYLKGAVSSDSFRRLSPKALLLRKNADAA